MIELIELIGLIGIFFTLLASSYVAMWQETTLGVWFSWTIGAICSLILNIFINAPTNVIIFIIFISANLIGLFRWWRSKIKTKFKCRYCGKKFSEPKRELIHDEAKEPIQIVSCPHCGINIKKALTGKWIKTGQYYQGRAERKWVPPEYEESTHLCYCCEEEIGIWEIHILKEHWGNFGKKHGLLCDECIIHPLEGYHTGGGLIPGAIKKIVRKVKLI